MFSIQFLKPYLILEIRFQKFIFFASGAHFLKKLKIFNFFKNLLSGHVAHV